MWHVDCAAAHKVIAINCIQGILVHSYECEALAITAPTSQIPLHPYLQEYANRLFHNFVPLAVIYLRCQMEVIHVYGNTNHDCNNQICFGLQDVLSLYCTYSNSHGIVQLTFPEEHLDKWFCAWAAAPPHTWFP